MKKLLALLLAAMMLFSLTACDLNDLMTQLEEVANSLESLQSSVNSEIDENDENVNDNWPNDTFTAHVPKPTFATFVKNTEDADGNYNIGHYYFSIDEELNINALRAYVNRLEDMGFTEKVSAPDLYTYYNFSATNSTTKVIVELNMFMEPDGKDSNRRLTISIPK